jgi:hypothetical protein
MKKTSFYMMIAGVAAIFASCRKELIDQGQADITSVTISSPAIGVGIITGTDIYAELPFMSDISAVTGAMTLGSPDATVSPDLSSGIDFTNGPVFFTVTAADEFTKTYSMEVATGGDPMRLALVGDAATISGLAPEVAAAYNWALAEYGVKARYIPFSELDASSLESATTVWFHLHDYTPGHDLPASAISGNALTVLTDFYKAGGNMLLTGLATPYLVNMGRLSSDWAPTDGGDGANTGNANPDDWGVGYQIPTNLYDGGNNKNHPMFAGLTNKSVTFDGVTYDALMFINGGLKRDAGRFWFVNNVPGVIANFDTNGDGVINDWERSTNGDSIFNNDDNVTLLKGYFEQQTSSVVRGSFEWDPVFGGVEFFTIVEFNPVGNFSGKAVTFSAGCYEWHHEDGRTNAWRDNVEGWTANTIKYLGVQ